METKKITLVKEGIEFGTLGNDGNFLIDTDVVKSINTNKLSDKLSFKVDVGDFEVKVIFKKKY